MRTAFALALTALATTAVMGSACSKKKAAPTTPTTSTFTAGSGIYTAAVPADGGITGSCFPTTGAQSNGAAALQAGFDGLLIDVTYQPPAGSGSAMLLFVLSSSSTIAQLGILPTSYAASIGGNTLGPPFTSPPPASVVLSPDCTVQVQGTLASGIITEDDAFTLPLGFSMTIAATGSDGSAGFCSQSIQSLGLVPAEFPYFPAFAGTNGGSSCTLNVNGSYTLSAP